MADATSAIVLDAGTTAAVSGIAAATSAARHRKMLLAYYGRKDVDLRSNPTNESFNTTSYMNYLRGPPSPLRFPPRGHHGVGVHIHYQGHCPHGPLPYRDHYVAASHSESDAYPYPQQTHHASSPQPYPAGYPSSPCGCSQCYWRDFNLRELVRRHQASPTKSREDKDAELEKLYWYYVGRVSEIYGNHCRHHRLLFRDVCLSWEPPEKVTLPEEEEEQQQQKQQQQQGARLTPVSRRHSSSNSKSNSSRSRSSAESIILHVPSSSRDSTSRDPTPPLPRGESESESESASASKSQHSVEAGVLDKGKEKELVMPSLDGDAHTVAESVYNDNDSDNDHDHDDKGKGKGKAKEEIAILPMTITPITKPPHTRSHKAAIQQRLRQLWPAKSRGKSSDKAELAQLVRKDGDRHEGDERESVV
ncbi:hypothetical protein F4859DRAFT_522646 [Xylaria cf. heliscus]|nr:hypothetical protein F4859DRAFT_522646 [Xylaria cf. heliscus]